MAKILFVEDDIAFSHVIKEWLVASGHVVDLVHSADDAMSLLDVYNFDLLILDWELGDQSGIEICSWYRQRGGCSPVLVLTGCSRPDQKELGLDSGADDYLTKPPNPKELLARIRALLRRPSQLVPQILTVRHVQLDPKTRLVQIDGRSVNLLPREFALLEFLMRHPDQAFSSDELLDAVWSSDSAVTPDTVRVCIQRLRGKIDLKDAPSMVRNIYGVGYIMDSH